MRTAALLAALLTFMLGCLEPALAAAPTWQSSGGATQTRRYEVSFGTGDSGDSLPIPNAFTTWSASFFAGSGGGGAVEVYAVPLATSGSAGGTLLASFAATSASSVTIQTNHPFLVVKVTAAPASGTAKLWLAGSLDSGGAGGPASGSTIAKLYSPSLNERPALGEITRMLEGPFVTEAVWSPLNGDGFFSLAAQTAASAIAACNVAFPDTNALYLLSDSNGACAAGGTILQTCRCQATSAIAGALYAVSGGDMEQVWQHTFSGVDSSGGGFLFTPGIPDWEGPYAGLEEVEAGSCAQEQWVPGTGRLGSPYLPVNGHTMAMQIRGAGLTVASATQARAGISFWGFVESGNADMLLNASAVTVETAIQGITHGGGLLWYGHKFHAVSVRAGVEDIRTLIDITVPADFTSFFTSQRTRIHAILGYDLVAPAATGSISGRQALVKLGLFPIGATSQQLGFATNNTPWQRIFALTGANNVIQVPSGTPAAGYAGLVPVVSLCGTSAPAWTTPTSYVLGQRVTQAANTYVCLIAHTSGAVFNDDLTAGRWVLNNANPQLSFGAMALGTVEHGF